MEWVNIDGKPGEEYTKTHFNYSEEALQILNERWNGLTNKTKMTKKTIDLAVCFAAGHLIEAEKFAGVQTVSQRIRQAGDSIWGTMRKGKLDHHMVAWLLSLIDVRSFETVLKLEKMARQHVDANRERLEAIENRLIEKGYIDGEEFKQIRGKA